MNSVHVSKQYFIPLHILAVALLYWLLDSALHSFLGQGSFLEQVFSPQRENLYSRILTLSLLMGGGGVFLFWRNKNRTSTQYDLLTHLPTQAHFRMEYEKLNAQMTLPLAIIIGDIDGLKTINDVYGYEDGDVLLQKTTDLFLDHCGPGGRLYRWSGDSFTLFLPETSGLEAQDLAQSMSSAFQGIGPWGYPMNLSLGLATKESEADDLFSVLRKAEDRLCRSKILSRNSTRGSFLTSLERSLLEKSEETEGHASRMQQLALQLGRCLDLPENQLDELILLAALHDIGKLAISEEILKKPGPLAKEEWAMVRRHPEVGAHIARASKELYPVVEGILCHHERWDGGGYPQGLKGEEIPLIARIVSIVDAFDVMITGRPYKKAVSREEACKELKRCAGTQFDPDLVQSFLQSKIA